MTSTATGSITLSKTISQPNYL